MSKYRIVKITEGCDISYHCKKLITILGVPIYWSTFNSFKIYIYAKDHMDRLIEKEHNYSEEIIWEK